MSEKIVVNVRTQKEWDKVSEKTGCQWLVDKWDGYKEKSGIDIECHKYSNIDYYKKNGYKVISFEEFMNKDKPKSTTYQLIVTDKKVIILDKENNKKGVALCPADDKFEFSVGVNLAWNRLHGIETKEGIKIEKPILSPEPKLNPPEFKKCRVTNLGEMYYDYYTFANHYKLSNFKAGRRDINKGDIYNVVGYNDCNSDFDNRKIYVIEKDGKEYIVSLRGIEEYNPKLYDSFGVELKEGDNVIWINSDTNDIAFDRDEKYYYYKVNSYIGCGGISGLYTGGIERSHNSNYNNGNPVSHGK